MRRLLLLVEDQVRAFVCGEVLQCTVFEGDHTVVWLLCRVEVPGNPILAKAVAGHEYLVYVSKRN